RPNLTYRVLPRVDEWKQIVDVVERHRNEAGIIYCMRRKDVDSLTAKLRRAGYDAVGYHAGLSQQERRAAQDAFAAEKTDLVVATAVKHLNDIDRYCSGVVCRHRALVEYFGQRYSPTACSACDICLGETQDVADALIVAQKILSCVVRVGQSFGVGHVIAVLRGEDNDRV